MNSIKRKVKNGETALGCFIGLYSPALAEIAGYAGFDFVVIDNEHGSFSWGEVEHMIQACESAEVVPFVRVPSSDPVYILKALDRGAKGIHVPQVQTAEEAEKIVKAAHYPPGGTRGAAYSIRAAKYGLGGGSAYLEQSNEDVFIAVHIESPGAVKEVEGIIASGVDMVYIGPTDLSVSAGRAKEGASHPDVVQMIQTVFETGDRKKADVGIQVANIEELKAGSEKGARYMCIAINALINPAIKKYVDEARSGQ